MVCWMYNYCISNTSISSPRSVSTSSCTPSCFQGLPIYHPAAVVHHLPLQSQYIRPLQFTFCATILQLWCDHCKVPLPHVHYEHLQLIDRRASVFHYHLHWWWHRQGEMWPSMSWRWHVWVRVRWWMEEGVYMHASGGYKIETSTMWQLKLNRR